MPSIYVRWQIFRTQFRVDRRSTEDERKIFVMRRKGYAPRLVLQVLTQSLGYLIAISNCSAHISAGSDVLPQQGHYLSKLRQ